MTLQSYLKLKRALIQRRKEVTASPEAASRYIDKLGIRDLLVPIDPVIKRGQTKAAQKTATK